MKTLLSVRNLCVEIPVRKGIVRIVEGLNFEMAPGHALGIVGESGSGKSITAHAIMGLLPPHAIVTGQMQFEGGPIAKARGHKIGMIFQDPMSSLNPCYTVHFQLDEALRYQCPDRFKTAEARKQRCMELLHMVGIPDPEQRLRAYPYQLSGGISQRVMIAMVLAAEPALLIADEPTTALDVTIQAQILVLLNNLRKTQKMGLILITHDLGVVSQMVDDILVLYAGHRMEYGPKVDIIQSPQHPYTRGLMRSLPANQPLDAFRKPLPILEGLVPNLLERPTGCQFNPRCEFKKTLCAQEVPREIPVGVQLVRCHFAGRLEATT